MIVSFAERGTADVFNRRDTKAARRMCPVALWLVARRKLDKLNAVISLLSLRIPPGNRLEALGGERAGQHSVRINDRYRVCFVWLSNGPARVAIVDYH